MSDYMLAKEFEGVLWVKASDVQAAQAAAEQRVKENRAVMEQALEALEQLWVKGEAQNHQEAIESLKEALKK